MSILKEIVAYKKNELERKKELYPVALLESSIHFNTPIASLKRYLDRDDKVGIIAEIKRRSPSLGVINEFISVEDLSLGYMQEGASALSVLTDEHFFGGSSDDLTTARRFNYCPILRKDFIFDEYQVIEAKSIGADVLLLIASMLEPKEIHSLAASAKPLGLEVLLEVHNEEELSRSLCDQIDIVGVNNRNLLDFSVDLNTSLSLIEKIPKGLHKISESGISSADSILELRRAGYQGFLIGESFMKEPRPEKACAKLISALRARGL